MSCGLSQQRLLQLFPSILTGDMICKEKYEAKNQSDDVLLTCNCLFDEHKDESTRKRQRSLLFKPYTTVEEDVEVRYDDYIIYVYRTAVEIYKRSKVVEEYAFSQTLHKRLSTFKRRIFETVQVLETLQANDESRQSVKAVMEQIISEEEKQEKEIRAKWFKQYNFDDDNKQEDHVGINLLFQVGSNNRKKVSYCSSIDEQKEVS